MLAAAEARHARASQKRLPVLARGVRVGVLRGPFAPLEATIVDADYIESRVLLEWTDEQGERQPRAWVNFEDLSPPADY